MKQKTKAKTRRTFLKTAIATPFAISAGASLIHSQSKADATKSEFLIDGKQGKGSLPMRKLGRNGPEVTILSLGGIMTAHNPQFLNIAWSKGIRYFDTADCYKGGQSEKNIATWLAKYPERRKELFLVSKDHPRREPKQLLSIIDNRLKACGTDYLDLLFVHGLGQRSYGENADNWPKSREFKETIEALKETGKCKMVGFSTHDYRFVQQLMNAAEGGFVDAIMFPYNPFFTPGDNFDKAVEACYQAGIGLISMKEMRVLGKNAPKRSPEFDKIGLSNHQAILQAVWSDKRIASICSMINNIEEMEQNTIAARDFSKPITLDQLDALQKVAATNPNTFCPGCPSCARYAATTDLAFLDIARYVTYYEADGDLSARNLYRALPPNLRQGNKAELREISRNCQFNVDYGKILQRAEHYFS